MCGGGCGRAFNTSTSVSGGPGFKPRPSRCFLRQGTLLQFFSLHPGVLMGTGDILLGLTLRWTSIPSRWSSNTPKHASCLGNRDKLRPFEPSLPFFSLYIVCKVYKFMRRVPPFVQSWMESFSPYSHRHCHHRPLHCSRILLLNYQHIHSHLFTFVKKFVPVTIDIVTAINDIII